MFLLRNKKNIDTFWLKKVPYQELCQRLHSSRERTKFQTNSTDSFLIENMLWCGYRLGAFQSGAFNAQP